jgi:hypothetical protein
MASRGRGDEGERVDITILAQVLDVTDEETRYGSGLTPAATERLRDALEEAGFEVIDVLQGDVVSEKS